MSASYYAGPPHAQYPQPSYGTQASYPQQSSPPYPEQPRYTPAYPQQAPSQWQGTPPPQQQNYYAQPPQQQQQWNPEQIWAEANSPQGKHSAPATASRSGSPFVGGAPFANPQAQPGQEGERGMGATVLGGGAGAFLGHEMGHSKLATIGGLVAGAIAANAFEHHEKKKKLEREEGRAYDQGYSNGERRSLSGSRSRGIDDSSSYYERDSEAYDDDYAPRHHHHHHHDRDYDDDYVQEDSYSRRDDDGYRSRRDSSYYEKDSYVSRDNHHRRDYYDD